MSCGVQQHVQLCSAGTPVFVERSKVLSDAVASSKKYGDSWTCRSSTELLISRLATRGVRLYMDSEGKEAFEWGEAGKVSYHYFGVDNPGKPTVLLDPTACANFGRDVHPGGLMLGILQRVGQRLGHPLAAQSVARKVASGGTNGLLVLASKAEIAVFRAALDEAAHFQVRVHRTRERATPEACAQPGH